MYHPSSSFISSSWIFEERDLFERLCQTFMLKESPSYIRSLQDVEIAVIVSDCYTALSNIHGSACKVLFGTTGHYLDTPAGSECNRLTFPAWIISYEERISEEGEIYRTSLESARPTISRSNVTGAKLRASRDPSRQLDRFERTYLIGSTIGYRWPSLRVRSSIC